MPFYFSIYYLKFDCRCSLLSLRGRLLSDEAIFNSWLCEDMRRIKDCFARGYATLAMTMGWLSCHAEQSEASL